MIERIDRGVEGINNEGKRLFGCMGKSGKGLVWGLRKFPAYN